MQYKQVPILYGKRYVSFRKINITDITKTGKNKLSWKGKGDVETVKLRSGIPVINKIYFKIPLQNNRKHSESAFNETLLTVI